MLGRQSVKVTYAHKKRRVQNASKKLLSSPLEVLPPDTDDLTRTQMARRMLKRSRRVALAEQLEDANVEHIRDHLAKRIKRTQERVSNPESAEVPLHAAEHDFTFQTPFASSQVIREPTVAQPLVPDQLSPVPAAKRVVSRPSSRNLKENGPQPHILASPFSSRPGSAAPSPRHKGKSRSSRRVSRISLHAKSRTLSGVLKENTRGVSRKDSTVSLKDANRESSIKHIKHRRYPSSPSTAYMRSRSVQDGWISPPRVFSRTFDDFNEILSPAGSAHSNASFYTDQPQSCSTPAMSRLRKLPDLHGQRARADGLLASFSMRKGVAEAGGPDVEMIDGTAPSRRQTIHLSGNSIFSSSDEFTIASLPAMLHDGEIVEKNSGSGPNESLARVVCQAPAPRGAVDESQVGRSIAGSFVAEYAISLPDLDHSPASTTATKMLGPAGVPKLSIGEQLLGLPGTSPVRGNNLFIRASRNPGPPKSSVGEQPFGLPGTSPACGENLVIRTSRDHGTLTPPASPLGETVTCPPSSPASDLALELQSMGICDGPLLTLHGAGNPDMQSDGGMRRLSATIPPQTRSHSLEDPLVESATRKSVKRRLARNRASTIRPSDFVKPGTVSSAMLPEVTVLPPSNVRRTRSGTVVGPDSKLAARGARLSTQVAAKGAPVTRPAVVQSGSESESDDELLLKDFWTEGLEYLGVPVPRGRKDVEADELNLGGIWDDSGSGLSRRPGLRRK